jgi:hypothetical protein
MNRMRNEIGFVSLLGERGHRDATNPYWYLCQLSLTAWAKHLSEASGSHGLGSRDRPWQRQAAAAEECCGSHSAI